MSREAEKTTSRFEVRKDGRTYQSGPDEMMPPPVTRKQMRTAGYKIYVDGKVFRG